MNNKPLSANEHFKIVIFMLLLIPLIFPLMVGILPVLFLTFGYYMMKKNNDFSSVAASVKAVKIYCTVATILLFIVAAYAMISLAYAYQTDNSNYYYTNDMEEALAASSTFLVATLVCFFIVKYLYFLPLQNHSEWVAINGTFSN